MYIGKSFWSWDGIFQGHLSKVCVWNYTMSWEASLSACPRNKPGEQGDPVDLSFDPKDGAKLVVNNLGGLVDPSEPPIMRWENVGQDNGKKIDLVVKVLGPYVHASKATKRQGLVGKKIHGHSNEVWYQSRGNFSIYASWYGQAHGVEGLFLHCHGYR